MQLKLEFHHRKQQKQISLTLKNNSSVLVFQSIGREKSILQIQNIINGRSGFFENYIKKVWLTEKKVINGGVTMIRPFLLTSRLRMGVVGDVVKKSQRSE